MNTVNIFFSNKGTRNEVRKRVILAFLQEQPGQGSGNLASKYSYEVENLASGNKIVLTRPANLKNGFDFLIRVDGIDFNHGIGRYRDYPRHEELINDLQLKKIQNPRDYALLYSYIEKVYLCEEIKQSWFGNLNFQNGYPSDLILKTIKWFFIEQDIRYWNYSGRNMLMSSIP